MAKYKLGTRAAPRVPGMPAGVSPELIAQILAALQNRAANEADVEAAPESEVVPTAPPLKATGTEDPRVILPLDADERGFGDF